MRTHSHALVFILFAALAAGCNSPTGIAVQLVGSAIDAVDAKQLGEELVGKPSAAADARLGEPKDTWREVAHSLHAPREWRVYGVSMDVLGNQRYVVQTSNDKILSISKVKI